MRTPCSLALISAVMPMGTPASAQNPTTLDTAKIEAMSGLKGTFIADEHVFKIGKPAPM